MNKRGILKYTLTLYAFICLSSCMQGAKEAKNWLDASNQEEVKGKYTFMAEDGIKTYLPSVFKKYPLIEYQNVVKSLTTDEDYKQENRRLNLLRKMEGNFHIFYDKVTGSTYTINTLPYHPLSKRDAQYLLSMIRVNNEIFAEDSGLEFTKITAKYNAKFGPQIFKAVYRIDNTKNNVTSYNSTYIVSHNEKTVYIQLSTGYEVNFDPYLHKMIM